MTSAERAASARGRRPAGRSAPRRSAPADGHLLDLTGLDELIGCDWALREGIVLDAIGHHSQAEWTGDPRAMRRESVLGLCRRCGWNEAHARKVGPAGPRALRRDAPRSTASTRHDRDLLEFGALLHDIGEHVSMEGHEQATPPT